MSLSFLNRSMLFCIGVLWMILLPVASKAHDDNQMAISIESTTFYIPRGWKMEMPEGTFRSAVLKTPEEGTSESAEIVFFYFHPEEGGSTQDNLNRWFAQFEEGITSEHAKIAKQERNGIPITFASSSGTFLSGMPGETATPKPNFAMFGAILEIPTGRIFIKMTGPKPVVDKHAQAFYGMVMHPEKTAH